MPPRHDLASWNLKEIVRQLVERFPMAQECFLFGSRRHRTRSYRSDIDLLVRCNSPLPRNDVEPWLAEKLNPVDLFVTLDFRAAESVVNGSSIFSTEGNLTSLLQAVRIWSATGGFDDGASVDWEQFTLKDAHFERTILPVSRDFAEVANNLRRKLEEADLPDTHLGFEWAEIGRSVAEIVKRGIITSKKLGKKAKNISNDNLCIANEYDFQNLIQLVLKPWLPSLEKEPFQVKYAGQEKYADFGVKNNQLVIEAKFAADKSEEAAVMKQLSGLTDLYRTAPNIRCLLFLWYVPESIKLDVAKIEHDFSNDTKRSPIILTRLITG